MSHNQVKAGCGVVIINQNKQFLMMKRASKHGNSTYALPGGWIEFGEDFETAARREVMEELGVQIENIELLGVTNNIFPQENVHSVAVILIACLKEGTPRIQEPDKCSLLIWCDDWENMPSPLFTDYHKYISKEKIQSYTAAHLSFF